MILIHLNTILFLVWLEKILDHLCRATLRCRIHYDLFLLRPWDIHLYDPNDSWATSEVDFLTNSVFVYRVVKMRVRGENGPWPVDSFFIHANAISGSIIILWTEWSISTGFCISNFTFCSLQYYISPSGQRLRSKNEVIHYLETGTKLKRKLKTVDGASVSDQST